MDLINPTQAVAFLITATIIIVIPGPSVVFVVGRALTYGRAVALATVLGNSLGLLVALVLISLGLGAAVSESVVLLTLVKYLGAGYLIYLGVTAFRHRAAVYVDQSSPELGGLRAGAPSRGRATRQGFVVGITNPKVFVMFAAVLPQFVDRESGSVVAQMLVLGVMAFGIGLVLDSVWAVAASQLREWFNASPSRGRTLGAAGGASMVGLGLVLGIGADN